MTTDAYELAQIGTRVSYEDMANPRRHGVVADIRVTEWGVQFDIAWETGRMSATDLRQHGWRLEGLEQARRTVRYIRERDCDFLTVETLRAYGVDATDDEIRFAIREGLDS